MRPSLLLLAAVLVVRSDLQVAGASSEQQADDSLVALLRVKRNRRDAADLPLQRVKRTEVEEEPSALEGGEKSLERVKRTRRATVQRKEQKKRAQRSLMHGRLARKVITRDKGVQHGVSGRKEVTLDAAHQMIRRSDERKERKSMNGQGMHGRSGKKLKKTKGALVEEGDMGGGRKAIVMKEKKAKKQEHDIVPKKGKLEGDNESQKADTKPQQQDLKSKRGQKASGEEFYLNNLTRELEQFRSLRRDVNRDLNQIQKFRRLQMQRRANVGNRDTSAHVQVKKHKVVRGHLHH